MEQQLAAPKLADRSRAAILEVGEGEVGEDDIGEGLSDLKFHGGVGLAGDVLLA